MNPFRLTITLLKKSHTDFTLNGRSLGILCFILTAYSGCIPTPPNLSSNLKSIDNQTLEGFWAKKSVFTSELRALGIGIKSNVTRYSLLTASIVDGKLQVSEKLCDIKTKVPLGVTLIFPQALLDSLTDIKYHYELPGKDNELKMPLAVDLVGVKLNNPETDTLEEKKGAIFFDQDRDGFPGVTTIIGATIPRCGTIKGKAYIAQKVKWSESGLWENNVKASGKIHFEISHKVLGADNFIMRNVVPTNIALPEESYFDLEKLPSDKGSCQHVFPHDQ